MTSPPAARAAMTDSAPAPENGKLPVMIARVISEPPRICTGSTFKPAFSNRPASLATHIGMCDGDAVVP